VIPRREKLITGRSLEYLAGFGGSLRGKCRRTTDCADNADGNCRGSRIGCGGCRRHACHYSFTSPPRRGFQIEYRLFRLV